MRPHNNLGGRIFRVGAGNRYSSQNRDEYKDNVALIWPRVVTQSDGWRNVRSLSSDQFLMSARDRSISTFRSAVSGRNGKREGPP